MTDCARPRKRRKRLPTLPPLLALPTDVVTRIASHCDARSLLALRRTCGALKIAADGALACDAFARLPLRCNYRMPGCRTATVTVREGWSELYTRREELVDQALAFVDAGGRHHETDFDTGEARAALEGARRLDSGYFNGAGEPVKWRVKYRCDRAVDSEKPMPGRGLSAVKHIFRGLAEQAAFRRVPRGEMVPEGERLTPERLLGLLLSADGTSMRYLYYMHQYAGILEPVFLGKEDRALKFRTLDGKKMEVVTETLFVEARAGAGL